MWCFDSSLNRAWLRSCQQLFFNFWNLIQMELRLTLCWWWLYVFLPLRSFEWFVWNRKQNYWVFFFSFWIGSLINIVWSNWNYSHSLSTKFKVRNRFFVFVVVEHIYSIFICPVSWIRINFVDTNSVDRSSNYKWLWI